MSSKSTMHSVVMIATLSFLAVGEGRVLAESGASAESAQQAIMRHIRELSHEGTFSIHDGRQGKRLQLELLSVHETPHPVESGETFYCADFRGADGTLYDLDFYVAPDGESHRVVESFVHKIDGKDRLRPKEGAPKADEERAASVIRALETAWSRPRIVQDPRYGKELELALDHVHTSVKSLPDGSYFACVDARDAAGVLYDLDVYVQPVEGVGYRLVETIIHKRDGVERLR